MAKKPAPKKKTAVTKAPAKKAAKKAPAKKATPSARAKASGAAPKKGPVGKLAAQKAPAKHADPKAKGGKKAPAKGNVVTLKSAAKSKDTGGKARVAKRGTAAPDVDYFLKSSGLDSKREKEIGQHIGYRYDVNLVPDYKRITPFLKKYMELMGWDDLNWLEDVHMGYEEGNAAVFDRNANGWIRIPTKMKLPDNQQDRDMIARELLIKFQMSSRHPMRDLNKAYRKF